MRSVRRASATLALSLAILLFSPLPPAAAVLIPYQNCLPSGVINSKNPQFLQFIPLFLDARFDTANPSHNLNLTVYGNVSGQATVGPYPPSSDPTWSDPNSSFGKLVDIGNAYKYTTLFAEVKVLQYNAWNNGQGTRFCTTLENAICPVGPAFTANASDPHDLPAFSVAHDFGSPYRFSTFLPKLSIISGDAEGPQLGCVSASVTPALGSAISNLIKWLPAAILTLKGLATLSAAIWSPWGSSDIFRWSSNYGRDEDLLRLVTPGFGDCLQYIQFVTLTGALSLQYPGFYQPAVSKTAWSLLLFNQSFVTHGNGTQSLLDGVYAYNGTYGMTNMSQLIGMTDDVDVWACMAVWLLVIIVIVVLLCQIGFFGRWIYRTVTHTTEEDLRQKNIPFTLGNIVRLMFNYFILPIVALSLFQLVIAGKSPTAAVVMAVILFVAMLVAGAWILRVIFTTKPRTYLFDDMATVLLYGPLYNTYTDSTAPFALVPVFITFMRGIALGAVQPSGIAQIIVLAICEVVLILALNGFRPFQNQTSMNIYHTIFASIRLITVLLAIAFVSTLDVSESTKGWIGYAMLILHACVLVFGFFLNAAQTLVEVIARSMGVAGDAQNGATRGSIWNLRMLKNRRDRPASGNRGSMTSNAAILRDTEADVRSAGYGGRSRSMSASSQKLLNQSGGAGAASDHRVSGYENFSIDGRHATSPSLDIDSAQAGSTSNAKPVLTAKTDGETYYRPPRPRKATLDPMTPGSKTRQSAGSDVWVYRDSPNQPSGQAQDSSHESGHAGRDSPAPAYFRDRLDSTENLPRTDYAVREVDQYYRGQALSDQPARKLKTGPADPEGAAATAQGWFHRLISGVRGKQKEPTKGFEVVRSSRMPPAIQVGDQDDALEMQTSPHMNQEPYRDSPPVEQGEISQAQGGAEREQRLVQPLGFELDGVDGALPVGAADTARQAANPSPVMHPGMRAEQPRAQSVDTQRPRVAGDNNSAPTSPSTRGGARPSSEYPTSSHYPSGHSIAPSLAPIESVGDFDVKLPSRFNSTRSQTSDLRSSTGGQDWLRAVDNLQWSHTERAAAPPEPARGTKTHAPSVPRRSSRRTSSNEPTPTLQSFARHARQPSEDYFEGFDSAHASSNPFEFEDRPESFSVTRHRAADSISRNQVGANAALQGSSAQFFSRSPTNKSFDQRHYD